MREFYWRHRKPIRVVGGVLAGLILLFTVGGSLLYATLSSGLPDVSKLDEYDPASTTKIFASDGTLIATLFDENRTYVKYDKIAPVMRSAIVAIEDRRFLEHSGVDWKGIARAAAGNASSGGVEQGASTLTMQLARRLFLSDEQTYTRKVREAILARRIDRQLTKEKILELYLNEVYFGSGAYGVDAASGLYFAKNPDKLELWQAAMLAGLVQAPTAYSPLIDKPAALKRMGEVLQAMLVAGEITEQAVQEATQKANVYPFMDRPLASGDGMLKYPYFTTYVIRQLSEQFPENYVRRGGLKVVTTMDLALQTEAETALSDSLNGPGKALGADSGAVVALDNTNGDIVAMVGGAEWNAKSQFNAAWQAKRQPGSSFKMFIYSAALEAGYNPEQEFADTEAVFWPGMPDEWKPLNSDQQYMGAIPMRTGLQFSRNLVAAKVIAHLGPQRVVALAHKMGIESELPAVVSLALGVGEVTPLQMARAFSSLPTGGVLRANRVLKSVSDKDGKLLKDFTKETEEERVLSRDTATVMCEMLHRVVTGGTGQSANISSTFVAGKTGTTDSFVDAWFVGFTPHHTVSVWMGREDNKPMGRVYGGTLPADIFHRVAKAGLKDRDANAPLPGVTFAEATDATLCWDSTYLALPGCPKTYNDVFRAGVVPTRECPIHRKVVLKPTVAMVGATTLQATPGAPSIDHPTDYPTADPTKFTSASVQTVKVTSADIPDELNPRKDPEVVTPEGASIPYTEKTPELKSVKFVIEGQPLTAPAASPSPSVDSQLGIDGTAPITVEGEESTDDTLPASEVPSGDQTSVPVLGGDDDYPKAGEAAQGQDSGVIYQPKQSLPPASGEGVIPSDTVDR